MAPSGQTALSLADQTVTVLWHASAGSFRALVAAPRFAESHWLAAAVPLATEHRVALELKMLRVFLQHPGRVLSRAEVIDEVWGRGVSITDRVVDTPLVKLRRKIEADPAEPRHIISVRGIGYRFET